MTHNNSFDESFTLIDRLPCCITRIDKADELRGTSCPSVTITHTLKMTDRSGDSGNCQACRLDRASLIVQVASISYCGLST